MKTNQIYLKLKDHAVSGEAFELRYDYSRALLYTHPKPIASTLSNYYPETNYISHTNQRRSLFDVLYCLYCANWSWRLASANGSGGGSGVKAYNP